MTGPEKATILISLLLQLHQVQSQWWGGYSYSGSVGNSYAQPAYYAPYAPSPTCTQSGYYSTYSQPQTYIQPECYDLYEQPQTYNWCDKPSDYGPYSPQISHQSYAPPQIYNPQPYGQYEYPSGYDMPYLPPGIYDGAQLPIPSNLPPFAYPPGPSPIIIINGGGSDDDSDDLSGGRNKFTLSDFLALFLTLQGTNNGGLLGNTPPPPPPPPYWGAPPGPPDANQNSPGGNCCCCNCCSRCSCDCSNTKCGCKKSECGNSCSGNSNPGNGKANLGTCSSDSDGCNNCGTCTHITIIMPKSCSCE